MSAAAAARRSSAPRGLMRPNARVPATSTGELAPWESLSVDAVGNVIEFWGFKRNQGRVWALLYLRGRALSAGELQSALGLSKGAVSMLTRELEQWEVIRRVREPGETLWRFEANTNLMAMIGRVLEDREVRFVARVSADLAEAARLVRSDRSVSPEVRDRVARMGELAAKVEEAVHLFVASARLDVRGIADVLGRTTRRFRRRTPR